MSLYTFLFPFNALKEKKNKWHFGTMAIKAYILLFSMVFLVIGFTSTPKFIYSNKETDFN